MKTINSGDASVARAFAFLGGTRWRKALAWNGKQGGEKDGTAKVFSENTDIDLSYSMTMAVGSQKEPIGKW
jgi:hypothetical protein